VRQTGQLLLVTSRGTFDLALAPHDMRAANYRAEAWGDNGVRVLERAPVRTYKGYVRGSSEAQVRLTIDETTVEGLIITPDRSFFIEPARHYSKAATKTDFLFYDEASIKQSPGECGLTLAEEVRTGIATVDNQSGSATKGATIEKAFGPPLEISIATEADFEYYTTFGSNVTTANNEILGIMNQVEGIYDTQLGLQFNIIFSRVWDTASDPYTSPVPPATEISASTALNEFRTYYNANAPAGAAGRDIAHMWAGRDFTGGTIGIAFRPGFECPDAGVAYGISQNITGNRAGLSAHEIGHNFNAAHPNQLNPVPPDCNTSMTIMNSFITSSTTFCQFSRDQITNHSASNVACLTRLTPPGCTYSISPSIQPFGTAGGNSSVNVTAGTGCNWAVAEGASWLTITSGEMGTGNGIVNYSVTANSAGPREVLADIAGQQLRVTQAASASCRITPISPGQTLNGTLATSDCLSGQTDRPNAFIDLYTFTGLAGQQIRIEMSDETTLTPQIDTFLYLFGPDGTVVAENDDIVLGQETNSRIPLNGFFTLPQTGTYFIEATSFDNNEAGAYVISLTANAGANTTAFSSANYAVNEGVGANGLGFEGTGLLTVNVTRSGDISSPASVDYATTDATGADGRKDYTLALGTLRFAAGDPNDSFTVLISDDTFQEPPETLNLVLSNAVGTSLGGSAVVTITSNDATPGPNPVRAASFNPGFFARQHYHDFLNREPDLAGLQHWVNQTSNCGNPDPLVCRINVSAAFFLSIEFQETGYLVYRFYKAAYGDAIGQFGSPPQQLQVPIIRLNEFLPDTQEIGRGVQVGIGNWQQQLETNKQNFALAFVQRSRFKSAYAISLTPAEFVDQLFSKAGVTPTSGDRQAAIDEFGTAANTADTGARGRALRRVAENANLAQQEFNRAFVLMQYFGYLRRNPNDPPDADHGGWKFWLDKLNQFNGNFVNAQMVQAFIESIEYVERFGP
jgi:hypothetical protein